MGLKYLLRDQGRLFYPQLMVVQLSRGADSVKLPRSMKIPTKAAALSLLMISLCFLTKLALWSLFDDGFTYIQSLKQVLHHINLVFHKIYIPLMSKMSSVIHLLLSFILISHFRFVFPTICHNCRTWRLSCRVALLPCYPESAPRCKTQLLFGPTFLGINYGYWEPRHASI